MTNREKLEVSEQVIRDIGADVDDQLEVTRRQENEIAGQANILEQLAGDIAKIMSPDEDAPEVSDSDKLISVMKLVANYRDLVHRASIEAKSRRQTLEDMIKALVSRFDATKKHYSAKIKK